MKTNSDKATIREVYEISRRLEDKMDALSITYALKTDVIEIKKDVEELKKWKYYFTGVAAAVGSIMSFFIAELRNLFIK